MFQIINIETNYISIVEVVDNFNKENQVQEPSSSTSWETTPNASTFKLFGGMEDA